MRLIRSDLIALTAALAAGAAAAQAPALRGTIGSPPIVAPAPAPAVDEDARQFLSAGVWRGFAGRADACVQSGNFQAFRFAAPASVEVGQGRPGQGESERLEILSARRQGDFVAIETRVCAPVGCNQTVERYRVLSQSQMQEWDFEGRLPGREPVVLVRDGRGVSDGRPGRQFVRCPA